MGLATDLFEAIERKEVLEDAVDTALLNTCGVNPDNPDEWPWHKTYYDPYDRSFEATLKEEWRPTEATLDAWAALGFARCWLYVKRHENEQYYALHGR